MQLQHQHYHNPPLQHLHASVQSLHSSLQSWLAPPTGAAAGGGGVHSSPLYSNIQTCLHQEMATLTQQLVIRERERERERERGVIKEKEKEGGGGTGC